MGAADARAAFAEFAADAPRAGDADANDRHTSSAAGAARRGALLMTYADIMPTTS